ncbi:MFS transporter [Pseudonocardia sp. CA-107938]|uniref:MFS transporter n=1 Tax=Pseudonocardia sp. CA-107938 TaxID=3240021 RepID=UPI003D8BD586
MQGSSRALALLVAGAFFMETLDFTVIAPAAPHIAADLGVDPVAVTTAVTAYVLTLAVLLPVSGWLADRFGGRRVFATALVVFTLASAACAFATSLPMLIAARALQGAGGALLVPVGRLVVLRATAKTDLVRAIAYLTWPALLAPVFAPALGGFLADHASWRWIFLINLPLGIVALVVALRIVPDTTAAERRPLDRTGLVLTVLGVAGVVVGMDAVSAVVPHGTVAAVALGVGAVALVAAVRHLLRAEFPLVDLRVLRTPTLRLQAAGGSVYRGTILAIPFLVPLFLQLGFGWTATAAGLAVVAVFVGNVGIKPITTPLMRRFGIRTVLLGSVGAGIACVLALAFVQRDTPVPVLLAVLLAGGVFRSIGFTAFNSVAFADVPEGELAHANTLVSTVQELAVGVGVAAAALFVRLGELVVPGADGPFRVAFWLLAGLLLVPAYQSWRLARTAGDHVTGRA